MKKFTTYLPHTHGKALAMAPLTEARPRSVDATPTKIIQVIGGRNWSLAIMKTRINDVGALLPIIDGHADDSAWMPVKIHRLTALFGWSLSVVVPGSIQTAHQEE